MKPIWVFHFPSQDPFCHVRPKTQGGALAKKLKHYSDFVDFERKLKNKISPSGSTLLTDNFLPLHQKNHSPHGPKIDVPTTAFLSISGPEFH